MFQTKQGVSRDDDDDDEVVAGIYENGHWFWDDRYNELMFKSDLTEIRDDLQITTAILGAVEFKEDIDLNEQQRFRKRLQRKTSDDDVVTLQDIKDVVLFTAPGKVVMPTMINLLHLPATERFLRALIFFCQYYIQISDLMSFRTMQLQTKVRTPESEIIESKYLENLEDIRLLVAKEYSSWLIGSGDFAKFHHMGLLKKSCSLTKKESLLFETFVRIAIQIIWIALGRKSYSQIELEVNRLFKSRKYNSAEHKLDKDTKGKLYAMNQNERDVLFGHCMRQNHGVNIYSPVMKEVHCSREIDHRIFGLGIVKYPRLSDRLRYMEYTIALPEHLLDKEDIPLGILGLTRNRFDILLKEIKIAASASTSSIRAQSKCSRGSRKTMLLGPLYEDIILPPKDHIEFQDLLNEFPTESIPVKPCNEVQRRKWMQRALRKRAKIRGRSGSRLEFDTT